jgi:hypothetical protein
MRQIRAAEQRKINLTVSKSIACFLAPVLSLDIAIPGA